MSSLYDNAVLLAKDVAFLVAKREYLGKLILSVKGTITALSDLTRAGKSRMFMVEVDKCIILIVKDFHLEWHSLLEVGDVFVFGNLRLTTLEKGVTKPCSVLLALESSSCTRLSEDTVTPVSIQEWLKLRNICGVSLEPQASNVGDSEERQELVNYEGIITSSKMAVMGIFDLDHKLRLVTASNSVSNIKEQCRVFVYNAHIIKDGSQAYIVCCMRSCIRVSGLVSDSTCCADSTSTDENSMNEKLRISIQNVIRKYGLNLKEILVLKQLYCILKKQGRSSEESLFAKFLKYVVCPKLEKSCVQATDLFISHDQFCPFNQSQFQKCRLPQVMDLLTLKTEVMKIRSKVDSDSDSLVQSDIKCQSSSHHLKVFFSDGQVLLGQIMTCSEGMVFQDGARKFRVIILSNLDGDHMGSYTEASNNSSRCFRDNTDYPSQPHVCCQCCLDLFQPGKQLTCPILDSWLIGTTICVTKFHVILEDYFNSRKRGSSENDTQNQKNICLYLAFSLLDCILVDKAESITQARGGLSTSYVSSTPLTALSTYRELAENEKESVCYIHVNEKLPLTYISSEFKQEQACQFQLLGNQIDPDFTMEQNIMCCRNGCVRNRNGTFTACSENLLSGQQDSPEQKPKPVCVFLTNTAAKWYSFITTGHLYKLMTSGSSRDIDTFKFKFLKGLPQKVTEYINVRMNIEVPKNVFVERIPLKSTSHWTLDDVSITQPIGQILSASFSEPIVSFKGVIVGRECDTSFTSFINRKRMTSPSMTHTQLEVQELLSDTKSYGGFGDGRVITIYLDAPKAVYTLGLVPGAVVKFCRVERRVSKLGNVYCKFNAVSAAEVVQFQDLVVSSSDRYTRSQRQAINWTDLPRKLLFNVWHSCKDNQVFSFRCQIERIFSLRIKTVCSFCRSLYSKSGCHSRDCDSSALPVVVTNAVLLVDDGTCQATVKIWNSALVSRLLTLTQEQWDDLVTEVRTSGEVVLDSPSPPTSHIAIFLQTLIASSLVLRPCRMAAKISKGVLASDLDKMRLEDFQENEVRVGKHVLRTLSLPRMQLECLGILEIG